MNQDWKIRGTQGSCEHTGEPFADEQPFYTCIFEEPASEDYIRRDFSVEAWNELKSSFDPPPFSFWKSTYKAPVPVEETPVIEGDFAEMILRRFVEEDKPETEQARFILALMLERKKAVVHTDTRETDERKILFYEHADSGEVFIIPDPNLRLEEIEPVQKEVASLIALEEEKLKQGSADQPGEESEESSEESSEEETASDEPADSPLEEKAAE